jgi:hypothetical protein
VLSTRLGENVPHFDGMNMVFLECNLNQRWNYLLTIRISLFDIA